MTLKTLIRDGQGTGNLAGVSNVGELIVAGIGDPTSQFVTMNVNNTIFNFFPPLSGNEFIITTIIASAPANATVSIFEAKAPTSSIIDRLIIKFDFRVQNTLIIPLPFGGFFRVNEGEFINALTDTQPVNMTIIGFYRQKG